MPLNIPTSNLGPWAAELVAACQYKQIERQQRGANFRNLYLTGSATGQPQTYKKTYAYIQTLQAMLYSPIELRFSLAPYGLAGPRERAMGRAGAAVVLDYVRGGSVDTTIEDAVEWGLVKGKTFVQLEWSRNGIEPYMVQPETMGVLREDLPTLDRQDAFVHSTWLTKVRFADLIRTHPRYAELMRKASAYISGPGGDNRPDQGSTTRQVVIGGQLYPYRPQGTPGAGQGRGLVDWLSGPAPEMEAQTVADLIRLDELWVWDRDRDDWTTIQIVGNDCIIEGELTHRNIFAEAANSAASLKKTGRKADANNPLAGLHPFVEICPNPLPDYFWGWSEMMNVATIQMQINNRVDGINRLLRLQEDPPTAFSGSSSSAQQLRAKLRRPGGYHVENSPTFKVEKLAPEMPPGLWQSLHELEAMFDTMGGMVPVTQGQGEAGVRAQGHAETLVRMGSTRFRDRALGIERDVQAVGAKVLALLRAHCPDQFAFFVHEGDVGPFKGMELDPLIYEPPAPKMVALPYQMHHIGDRFKMTVDGHSSSPLFSHEARQLAFDLNTRGATDKKGLLDMTAPPGVDGLIADEETREAQQAALIAQHPELLMRGHGGKKH